MTGALYDSVIADYYDASPLVANRKQDLAFYLQSAAASRGPILELGCGTGRIAIPLAESGARITGLDISQKMLERAEQKRSFLAPERRDLLRLIHGDMTGFELREQFPLIIIPFRPFQHLRSIEEQLGCLTSARRHLAKNGRLVMDFFQTDAARMHDPKFLEAHFVAEYEMAGVRKVRLFERIAAFHRAEQCNDVEMSFEVTQPTGQVERHVFAFTFRYFFRYEVEHLLARCGFRLVETFGDFDRSPLQDDSPEMIFVAEAV
jgi:ubiquinone/menaquinone biosynthesis C-methylase UbiE